MPHKPVVLLVEDEPLLVLIAEDDLSDAGFSVFSAMRGDAAIAEIDSRPDGFVCLVTDIRLGGDIDGWEVARHARAKSPNIGVVYVTGTAAADWSIHGVPGSVMLAKPVENGELVATIAEVVKSRVAVTS